MIQAHPSLFMRQVHNYQKVGKAGVVITGEGQSSCWTCRGPRGLLLQKKKQPPKKSSDLDVWVNHRAVKLALSTLPTLINWHLPAANPPPPVLLASHMLYDKKIRPLNEWRHGGLVNRPCDDGDTVRGGRFTRLPSKRRSEAWKLGPRGGGDDDDKKLSFCSLHRAVLETRHTSHASCRVDGFASHWPICMLMKRNWSPLNSFCFKM